VGRATTVTDEDEVAVAAADLAERILDEVSSSDQDWGTIAAWAAELADLARGAAAAGFGDGT
jgi:hypothetical protein